MPNLFIAQSSTNICFCVSLIGKISLIQLISSNCISFSGFIFVCATLRRLMFIHVSMWSEFGLCIKSLFDAKRNPPSVEYSVFAFLNWSQSSSRAVTYIIYSTFKMLFSLTCKWQLRSWLHAVPPVILTEYGLSWMRWKELARREYEMHSGDLWCCYARWYQ